MSPVLSSLHLARRFALFALTLLFLLTALRAGLVLVHDASVVPEGRVSALFIQGWRVDLALIGVLLLPAVSVAPLLGAFAAGRGLARLLVSAWLTVSVFGVLLLEYLTPALLRAEGVRPDQSLLLDPARASASLLGNLQAFPVQAVLGAVLIVLVLIAFRYRLDTQRLLVRRLSLGSALALSLFGTLLCLIAAWSGIPGVSEPLTLAATRIGGVAPPVDELVLNTAWKVLYPPVIEPLLSLLSNVPHR